MDTEQKDLAGAVNALRSEKPNLEKPSSSADEYVYTSDDSTPIKKSV